MVPSDHDSCPPKLKSAPRSGNVPPLAKRVTLPVPQITFASRADEDVMLDPIVFRNVATYFRISPATDVFASAQHHQLPNYFTADPDDTNALGCNAFAHRWHHIGAYINPPWSLLSRVLEKIRQDRTYALLVIPEWKWTDWWFQWKRVVVDYVISDQPIYLSSDGLRRAKPRWNTVFSIID